MKEKIKNFTKLISAKKNVIIGNFVSVLTLIVGAAVVTHIVGTEYTGACFMIAGMSQRVASQKLISVLNKKGV